MSDKYHDAVAQSHVLADDDAVKKAVSEILDKNLKASMNKDVYRLCLSCIDLTTLATTDSPTSVSAFVERVNAFDEDYPELPHVAAICVYPNFAEIVRTVLDVTGVNIACVSAGFPSAQTFPEVKVAETALAVSQGANEIDVVNNVGLLLDGDYESVSDELSEIKNSCHGAKLKVILETGALKTAQLIKTASILALYSGADFLKTSTGKVYPGASLEAAYVMCQCIKEYYEATGTMVGFKAAGGVAATEEAVMYYCVVRDVLGDKWMTPEYFRIGASRLANNLLSSITGVETKHF